MSIEVKFGNFFKPEVKSSGRKLFALDKISISNQSDTGVMAYARVTPPFKVTLSSEGIESTSITADCNCPLAKKSRFCKHIWATLLCVDAQFPDFLSEKKEIEKQSAPEVGDQTLIATKAHSAQARQAQYRKEQYQKQKAIAKEKKREQKGTAKNSTKSASRIYAPEVELALAYFAQNGFPMLDGPDGEILAEAKKKLSRFFHPDRGGTHEESVELNQHATILSELLRG